MPRRRSINRDFESEDYDVEKNIHTLVSSYKASKMSTGVKEHVAQLHASPGTKYEAALDTPGWAFQTSVLTVRTFMNNWRNVGLFWMRLGMYVMLCLCIAFVYFQLGDSWKDVFSRAALLFFVVAFLTFMAIAGFPVS